jgi:transposase|tara:strand:- start:514 stop:1086 length:573 start_codon:yes stop_codon:yes gene_type:complete
MARVATHLSVSELEQQYRAAKEAAAARHYQAIWLLAKGHTVPEVAEMTSFGRRWLEQLLSRYNARGPSALGDQRRHNGRAPSILKPALLERLKPRLETPPPDGGLWTGPKVAAWLADELGLEKVAPQRGWEALRAIGWTIQVPRPRHPRAATAEEQEAFKKSSPQWSGRKPSASRRSSSRSSPATSTGSV